MPRITNNALVSSTLSMQFTFGAMSAFDLIAILVLAAGRSGLFLIQLDAVYRGICLLFLTTNHAEHL
ncbi:MAG: hypothetical protein QGD92_10130 [Gammaproteobacteria bacterium]|nr:hypothetical protein [Gammaproteobacteria bacterium]